MKKLLLITLATGLLWTLGACSAPVDAELARLCWPACFRGV